MPDSRPVAFRMPCCDSLNTPSPRFYAEIFNRKTTKGNFLTIDSRCSTSSPRTIPNCRASWFSTRTGRIASASICPPIARSSTPSRTIRIPTSSAGCAGSFPASCPAIGWPSTAINRTTRHVRDWKAALDATVIKRGVFCLVFHPHGWIRNEQIVDLIDHAATKHGKKVKFLTFREAQERLNKHLLGGHALRAADGGDNGVRLLDVDNDGYMDVVIGNDKVRQTRRWSPRDGEMDHSDFPVSLVDAGRSFGVVRPDGHASLLVRNESVAGGMAFRGRKWIADDTLARRPGSGGTERSLTSRARAAIAECASAIWTAMAAAS